MTSVKAVLWDLDGTLVDTEPYWIATEFALAEEHGATWSREHALELVGNDLVESGRYIRELMGLEMSAEDDRRGPARRRGRPGRAGGAVAAGCRRAAGRRCATPACPCGLVTMSYQRFVAPILAGLPPETFRVIVTGDEVERGKPHPEPYLTAAAALGVRPGRLRGHRGLQHRRRRRPRRPGARSWSWRTTSTSAPGPRRASSATR